MIKRSFDICVSAVGLLLTSPILIPAMVAVWLQDFHSPFYIAPRVGKGGLLFRMVKLRSMVVNADRTGVDSTGANDHRVTAIGRFVRRYKLDELTQLWNVLIGDMSIVGPRPNVARETELYTGLEHRLLSVRPGISDFASIVFSDEGEILADKPDPDLAYNQLIRPWKSRLGLFYIDNQNVLVDLHLSFLTAIAIFNRRAALSGVASLLIRLKADPTLIAVASRTSRLEPHPPPGANEVVASRNRLAT